MRVISYRFAPLTPLMYPTTFTLILIVRVPSTLSNPPTRRTLSEGGRTEGESSERICCRL